MIMRVVRIREVRMRMRLHFVAMPMSVLNARHCWIVVFVLIVFAASTPHAAVNQVENCAWVASTS